MKTLFAIIIAITVSQANATPTAEQVESFVISPTGKTCKQVATLAQSVGKMREVGGSIETARSIVGRVDSIENSAIADVYAMRLSPSDAYMHVMGACVAKMDQRPKTTKAKGPH
ncbi:MAG: hypothetical protein K8F27_07445 [Sulfuricellaceae bacterium]|nr:hypothetical protein [Sulfuricellaceae bacterium]